MPRADRRDTARRWATEPALHVWAFFAGDLPSLGIASLSRARAAGSLGATRLVLLGGDPSPDEERAADLVVPTGDPPLPYGLFAALEAAEVDDVRRLGVVGASVPVLEAGHRAGAGAIVGLAPEGSRARRALLVAEPDHVVSPEAFPSLHADRFGPERALRERVLLNPGPAVVGERVHRAIAGPDLCHREPEYAALAERVRAKLLAAAGGGEGWEAVLLAGSGTAAMEAMTGAAVRRGRRLLVCRNGVYGDRFHSIARRLGIEQVVISANDTAPIDPGDVAGALRSNPGVDAVAVVHHETTTGLLNPVEDIARVAREHHAVVAVDAISSLGAEELDLSLLDMVAGTSNKCLHGLPGVAFVLLSPRAQERATEVPPRSVYLDLSEHLRAASRGSVPFTPSIPAVMALDSAMDELFDEGIERRRLEYRERMRFLDRELGRLGLEPLVAEPHRSSSVRSLRLPAGVDYERLHDSLGREGYVIYAGLGDAARTSFRVCALGNLSIQTLGGFVDALESRLAEQVRTGVA